MAFWLGLAYSGARVAGVLDRENMQFEQFALREPNDFPDTPAGQRYFADQHDDEQLRHFRRPPAKRSNFHKLGIEQPFSVNWLKLISSVVPSTSLGTQQVNQRID